MCVVESDQIDSVDEHVGAVDDVDSFDERSAVEGEVGGVFDVHAFREFTVESAVELEFNTVGVAQEGG